MLPEKKKIIPTEAELEEVKNANSRITIREARIDEVASICRLFYQVYRYRYINDYVYHPEKFAEMISTGQLKSIVAELDGTLCGHVGLLRWNETPVVYEAALGVVDPAYKNSGLFGRIFKYVEELKARLKYEYCLYDFVTNHEFSQKMVSKFGYHDLALCLGSQVPQTQAKLSELGIGKDPEDMARYSLLVAVACGVTHPFGKEVILPPLIGEATDFLLRPLNLRWVPAPRFNPLQRQGGFALKKQPEQRAAFFDFHTPGLSGVESLIQKSKQLLREGFQYIAIDVPLNASGLGQLYDLLSSHGFFMSGYLPYKYSSQLAFRFQFLAPTKVSFDNIKMHSVSGQKLLAMVRTDYERNTLL